MISASSFRVAAGLAGTAVMAAGAGCFPHQHEVGEPWANVGGGTGGSTGGRTGGATGTAGRTVDAMGGGGSGGCAGPLAFADPEVETFVRSAISLPTGPISAADVAGLTDLYLLLATVNPPCNPSGVGCIDYVSPPSVDGWITSLGGVECLTALESLEVDAFQLNLDPLRALPRLETLTLGPAPASMPPVLPQVKSLAVAAAPGHGFVSKFPGLTSLTMQQVERDATTQAPLDLDEVAGLSGLTKLALRACALTDISPLSKLTNLSQLDLSENAITDLAPLVANAGLAAGDTLDVSGNGLTCASQGANIAALRRRGVDVAVDITCSP